MEQQTTQQKKRGYILLLTVLISSVLLSMSFGIFQIALKEVILASFVKDSARAFIASDRGLECALYWDREAPHNGLEYGIFPTSTDTGIPPSNALAVCTNNNVDTQLTTLTWTYASVLTSGTASFVQNFSDGTCAQVSIAKSGIDTSIISNGYSDNPAGNCTVHGKRGTQRTTEIDTNF